MNETDAKRLLRQLQYQERVRTGTLAAHMAQAGAPKGGVTDQITEQLKKLYGKEDFERIMRERQAKEALMHASLPTDMQDTAKFMIVFDLINHIEAAIPEMNYQLPLRPVIGTLHTGSMNGVNISVKSSGEYVIVVDEDLFTFALLLSKVIARSLPSFPDGGFSAEPDLMIKTLHSSGALDSFTELLMACLMSGSPNAARPYVVENQRLQSLAQVFVSAIEYFVLGREYGHIIANHLGGPTTPSRLWGETVDTPQRTWQDEFQADGIGVSLTLHMMRKHRQVDLPLSFWGIDLFLHMLDILEKSAWVLVHGTDKVAYKQNVLAAPPIFRRYSLSKGLETGLPKALFDGVTELSNGSHTLLEHAYASVKPQLLKMHEDGKRPASIWQSFVAQLSS